MKPAKILLLTAVVVLGSGLLLVAVFAGLGSLLSHSSSPTASSADIIDTCQDSARKALKDPDSARFTDWTAWETSPNLGVAHYPDEKDYSAKGMVNAKNGFGGYGGDEPYTCDASAHSGTISANAHPSG